MSNVLDLPGRGDYEASAPTNHANDPRNSEPSDAQLSWELSLLRKAFPLSECDDCPLFHEDSEKPCEVLHGDVDQDECPGLPELIADAQRAMQDEHEAMRDL